MIQKQKKKLENPTVSVIVGLFGTGEECTIKVPGESVGTTKLVLLANVV